MIVITILAIMTPIEAPIARTPDLHNVEHFKYAAKKRKAWTRRKASSGDSPKFRSCEEALRAGYSHMRRGQPGYSSNLDRDGDGVACDKVQ